MIAADTRDRRIAPILLCAACHEQIKGAGTAWLLAPADRQPRRGEVFVTHHDCERRFEAMSPPPPGWRWSTAPLDQFLDLLVQNTVRPLPPGKEREP
ncbi:MAG: hypothetical protein AB1671_19635 [Thermodesulfobacteriota bacterium]|jgi:hypothetical protein